ncbi:hypothetical protein V2J09_002515 [Rumex salicifolius]
MTPPRILLCGDVLGRLTQLFKRVSSVNKSAGPFDALLCVGQFFPDSADQLDEFTSYVEGTLKVPIPTYFIGDYGVGVQKFLSVAAKDPRNQGFKMDGFHISDNLYWLKGSGKFQLHGLCVAYLSGRQSSSSQPYGKYSQDDVDALRAIAEESEKVDVFLGVTNKAASSDIPGGISDSVGSDCTVTELVTEIKPRFHIAGSMGVFYAREPYSNIDAVHVTRFIGLAYVGNKSKQVWFLSCYPFILKFVLGLHCNSSCKLIDQFYFPLTDAPYFSSQKFMHAISPTPASTMTTTEIRNKPPNTTLFPFALDEKNMHATEMTKRPLEDSLGEQHWRYDVKKQKVGEGGNKLCFKYLSSGLCPRGESCHFRHDAEAREQYLRGVCFDFLNKGKCERGPDCQFKHSLVEEGDSVPNRKRRIDGASGARSKECWFCLSSPNVESHLIISIGEFFYYALPKGGLVDDHVLIVPIEHLPSTLLVPSECEQELYKFQGSLQTYCQKKGKEMIFSEFVSKRGSHANLQAVPLPSGKAAVVKKIFNLAAEKLGFEFKTIKDDNNFQGRKSLKSQVDGGCGIFYVELPDGTILYHAIEENANFPAQFGREVLAGLLKIPEKADWRNCKPSKEEEEEMVEAFKSRSTWF